MNLVAGTVLAGLAAFGIATPRAVDDPPFSSAPVSVPDTNVAPEGQPELLAVEVGHHDTFDRVVFRFSSRAPGYNVNYVDQVTTDPSDEPVPLEGTAFMVVAMHSVASAQVGAPPAPQGRQTPRFPQLREIAGAGDFEGVVSFGLGLTAQTEFRAFTLTGPDRLVVDIRLVTLAETGSTSRPLIVAALVLVLVGAVVLLVSRRRRDSIPAGE